MKLQLQTEADLLRDCKQFLHILEHNGLLTWMRLHSGGAIAFHDAGKTRFRPNHDMIGAPDLIIWLKQGPTICIELKSSKGKVSPHQEAFKQKIEYAGHIYAVVRSLEQLETILAYNGLGEYAEQK